MFVKPDFALDRGPANYTISAPSVGRGALPPPIWIVGVRYCDVDYVHYPLQLILECYIRPNMYTMFCVQSSVSVQCDLSAFARLRGFILIIRLQFLSFIVFSDCCAEYYFGHAAIP